MAKNSHETFYKDMKAELDEFRRYTTFYNSYLNKSPVKKNRALHDEILAQKKRLDKSFRSFLNNIVGV